MNDPRTRILDIIKRERSVSVVRLSGALDVTYEAIRQHLIQLEQEGVVRRRVPRPVEGATGRPAAVYSLTNRGDHLFAKRYDDLALRLLTALDERLGAEASEAMLRALTDARVEEHETRTVGRMLERRLETLRAFYLPDDPFMSVLIDDEGPGLVETNCPYLNVAMEHPAICSTSVSALSRLLGYQVVRTERFQEGDRRCVFRVRLDEPIEPEHYGYRQEPAG